MRFDIAELRDEIDNRMKGLWYSSEDGKSLRITRLPGVARCSADCDYLLKYRKDDCKSADIKFEDGVCKVKCGETYVMPLESWYTVQIIAVCLVTLLSIWFK